MTNHQQKNSDLACSNQQKCDTRKEIKKQNEIVKKIAVDIRTITTFKAYRKKDRKNSRLYKHRETSHPFLNFTREKAGEGEGKKLI